MVYLVVCDIFITIDLGCSALCGFGFSTRQSDCHFYRFYRFFTAVLPIVCHFFTADFPVYYFYAANSSIYFFLSVHNTGLTLYSLNAFTTSGRIGFSVLFIKTNIEGECFLVSFISFHVKITF